jgi:hypothetical protein
MLRPCRWLALAVFMGVPLTASAQTVICPTTVTYYAAPAPVVTYAAPAPVVTYAAPAPVVTYAAPAPVVTYAAPAPVSVSTYRYGLFGRRSVTTVNYGAPFVTYASPVVVRPRRAYYYAPAYIYP